MAKREEGPYRVYVTGEQRSQPGRGRASLRGALLAIGICRLLVTEVASWAGAPSADEARQVAARWIAAMDFDHPHDKLDPTRAAGLTSTAFISVTYDDAGSACREATATTEQARTTALACLHEHAIGRGRLRPWKARDVLRVNGALKKHLPQVKKLGAGATLVVVADGCDGKESTLILAVSRGPKRVPQVTAAFAQTITCDE
jgi:hypothetical protein